MLLLRAEASAHHVGQPHIGHASGLDGAGGAAHLRRAAQRLPVGGRGHRAGVLLPVFGGRAARRHFLRAQQMVLVPHSGHVAGSGERVVRQVPDARVRPHGGAGVLHVLPGGHHGGHHVGAVVARARAFHAVPFPVVHPADIRVY